MISINKTKKTFLKTSWILLLFFGCFQANTQTSVEEQVVFIPFETEVKSDAVESFDFNDGMGPPVEGLFASVLPEGTVEIFWKYNYSASLQDFIVYKKQDDKSWEVYKNINVEDVCLSNRAELRIENFNFVDNDLQIGSKVEYRIVARYVNGVKTEVSEPLKVIF